MPVQFASESESGLPSWFTWGNGTPSGAITPSQIGALYVDLLNGAVFVSRGLASTDWVILGGEVTGAETGVALESMGGYLFLDVTCPTAGTIIISDAAALTGTRNGIYWGGAAGDGSQIASIQTGSTGQYVWGFGEDGSTALPGGLGTSAITSGALPTITLASGTGLQVSTVRDVNLCVSTTTAGSVLVELSPDNVTYSTLFTKTTAATDVIQLSVPWAWYVRLTATTATLGTATYY